MKDKIFDYVEKDNVIYNLSGLGKLICFICMTSAVMYSYDIRFVVCVMIISLGFFKLAEIKLSQIKTMLIYVIIFLSMNFVLTFVFNPVYGTEIYGTTHELFRFNSHFIVTAEQMVYQVTKTSKYASVVPLGMIFLLTTNPSEFAASLNRAGLSYKGTYAVSLTLRYFPDTARDYNDIALAQQSRGLDLSKKEKLGTRIKNIINICVPLIFGTLDRIEMITNAMDLRGFGKNKKRTWYVAEPLKRNDFIAIVFSVLILAASLVLGIVINGSRFWNPFV